MTLADAVKLVNLRGKLMQSAVPQGEVQWHSNFKAWQMIKLLHFANKQVLVQQVQLKRRTIILKVRLLLRVQQRLYKPWCSRSKAHNGKAIALPVSVPSLFFNETCCWTIRTGFGTNCHWATPYSCNTKCKCSGSNWCCSCALSCYWCISLCTMDEDHAISTRSKRGYIVECGPGTVLSNLAKLFVYQILKKHLRLTKVKVALKMPKCCFSGRRKSVWHKNKSCISYRRKSWYWCCDCNNWTAFL